MKVLILGAGYGTRLYPVVKDTPKPLLDIGGKALIYHLLQKVAVIPGLSEVIVVTNDKFFGMFQLWARQNKKFPVPIRVLNDGTMSPEDRLGSVGDIQYVLDNAAIDDDLLVLGGDNLFDFSLDEYAAFARNNPLAVTIGLYDIGSLKDATRFGVVEMDAAGRITNFQEKPTKPKSTLIAMCLYYLPKGALGTVASYIRETGQTDKAGDYIQWMVNKTAVFGFRFQGKWYDIGSVESLREAQENF